MGIRTATLNSSHTNANFATTSWGMIIEARADRPALERLLRMYWAPVYAVVRRQGFGPHDASDLTQEFLSAVVLNRNLIGKADPSRGRFRSFLRRALKNFLIDRHRAHVRRAGGHQELTGHAGNNDQTGPVGPDTLPASEAVELDRLFDRRWAGAVIERALTELEDGLRADGLGKHWLIFETNVVGPAIRGSRPIALDELARRLGIEDAGVVSNMLQTAKRRFRRLLRDIVAETVASPGEIDEELAELKRLTEGGGASVRGT
ncbi:MAG: sigma-70 family RNA polymerase sigma factor [Phycisphaeraceae bacterium]|nr:sigma-70 family RNA polymerase sigma factor [Phycisphaeraceae bacterium]